MVADDIVTFTSNALPSCMLGYWSELPSKDSVHCESGFMFSGRLFDHNLPASGPLLQV